MSCAVWKFALQMECTISMPLGSKVLHVHEQDGGVYVWAEVNPSQVMVDRHFRIYGTGHPMPDNAGAYLGTVHLSGGALVFHVYERGA